MTHNVKIWMAAICAAVLMTAASAWAFPAQRGPGDRDKGRDGGRDAPPTAETPGEDEPAPPDRPRGPRGRRSGQDLRDRGRGPGRPFGQSWSDEDRERMRDFMRRHFPEAAQELEARRRENPEVGERLARRIMPEMMRLRRSFDEDPPEIFALRIEAAKNELEMRKQMRFYRHGPEDRREEIRAKMKGLVERNFDIRQELGQFEVRRLEEGLDRLRRHLEEQEQNRSGIVENELARRLDLEPGGPGPRHPMEPPPPRPLNPPDAMPPRFDAE